MPPARGGLHLRRARYALEWLPVLRPHRKSLCTNRAEQSRLLAESVGCGKCTRKHWSDYLTGQE